MGDNAHQIDAKEAENHFKTNFPILLEDEVVEIVFKSGRDFKVFTNKRILMVDVKGITGKKIEFLTILYSSIHAFSVQTAGKFMDRDTEMVLYLNKLGEYSKITQDFRKGKANLWAIQKVLCNHVLGEDKNPLPGVDQYKGNENLNGGIFALLDALGDNLRPINCAAIESALREDPPILQGSEQVEMAFQGHRDITLFTTKRVLAIDKKGLFAKKIQYLSLPWDKFVAFGIRTAGWLVDFDTEVQLYTELHFYPGRAQTEDSPEVPPRPEESCLELDFSERCVDIFKLKYYLSRRIIDISKLERGAPIPMNALTEAQPDPQGFERLAQWLGGDQRELDPTELDNEFHTTTKILLDDEKILMAFKAGRDISLFTNLRVMIIDVKGLSGCKILYTSLPYRSIRAYSVQSAGVWDRDSELTLHTRNRWHIAKVELEFRAGKTDIIQIQKLLSGFIVGRHTDSKIIFGPKNYGNHEKNAIGLDSFKAAIFNNSTEINADEVNAKFHFDIPMLLEEETVLRAFRQGRDMFVYTNRRLLIVDAKGISGQSVNYKTVPYRSMLGFVFETAGNMDRDAEIYTYTNISSIGFSHVPRVVELLRTDQSILIKNTDIYEMGKLILDHTVFDKTAPKDDVVPEIEIHY